MMEEINEMLNEQGVVAIQDLTTKFGLPIDFIKDCLNIKMSHSLP